MKLHIKPTIILLLLAALAINIRAADIPAFEFYFEGKSDKEKSTSLVFDVTETSTGHRNSHTLYIIDMLGYNACQRKAELMRLGDAHPGKIIQE
jgi:hypothetical protein